MVFNKFFFDKLNKQRTIIIILFSILNDVIKFQIKKQI